MEGDPFMGCSQRVTQISYVTGSTSKVNSFSAAGQKEEERGGYELYQQTIHGITIERKKSR